MTWSSPLALFRDAIRGQGERERALRTLTSNLPYEGLDRRRQPNRYFCGNAIKTTRYSPLFFIPLNLYEQFHRVANIYFVVLAVLNFVPAVNAFEPEVAVIPICVILALTALKDGWEDFRRFQSDRKLNHTPCLIFRRKEKEFVEQRWKDIRVGDFVKMVSNEIVPADLLLLHTSDPGGVCLIETANLDGETSLKQRNIVSGLTTLTSSFEPELFSSKVVCEKPNSNLNHFKGYVETPDEKKLGIGIDNLLLRGCTVRNTDFAVGFVVFAGSETKSMLNNSGPRYKRSRLERELNNNIYYCIVLLCILCVIGATGHFIWLQSLPGVPLYLVPDNQGQLVTPALSAFYTFFTMIILLQIFIPISLYVSVEIVKIGQILFINNDIDLYDEGSDSRVQCRALNIAEDLGQIQHIFSDKTGTLTENKMVFRRCSILGTEYSHKENAIRLAIHSEDDTEEEVIFQQQTQPAQTGWTLEPNEADNGTSPRPPRRSKAEGSPRGDVAFSSLLETEVVPDRKLLQQIEGREGGDGATIRGSSSRLEATHYVDFFLALAICNTVLVSKATAPKRRVSQRSSYSVSSVPVKALSSLYVKITSLRHTIASWQPMSNEASPATQGTEEDIDRGHSNALASDNDVSGNQGPSGNQTGVLGAKMCYEAESPDEAALVHAAKAYGFTLLARTHNSVTVRLPTGRELTFEVLDTLPFDSNRKRMSVLVRHPVTRELVLYTKGADYAIMELLGTPYAENVKGNQATTASSTQRHIDWYAKEGLRTLCIAKKVLSEEQYREWRVARREAMVAIASKEQLLMETAVQLETTLTLLGATGVEDRLQENVPETIQALREAGIQVWVLTGDKTETAVNIAYSCRLVDERDLVINMSCTCKLTCASTLDCTLEEVRRSSKFSLGAEKGFSDLTFALVIDGVTLAMALESDLRDRFVELAGHCRSVLCCRVTPLQKSAVVQIVREKLKVMTLAIGDGANDVNMIQAADVGIGISGQEGMQAVMASDFAISRFKHLTKLLLVHGHWCYTRLSGMVTYYFYKNVAYVNLLFWYQFYCGFSGTAMMDYWLLIFFNLFFTSIPPIMFGVMDRDTSAELLLGVPELYRTGQGSEDHKFSTFWIAMLDAFYQSLVCFFIPYWTYQSSDIDLFTFGTPINTISLFTILLHLSIEIKTWTVVHGGIMLGSVALYFIMTLTYSFLCITCNPPSNPYWVLQRQMADPIFYLVCIITTVVALLPRYTFHVLRNTLSPSPLHGARQLDRLNPSLREQWIKEWRSFRSSGEGKRHGLSPPLSADRGLYESSSPPPPPPPPSAFSDFTGSDVTLNVISRSSRNPL